MTGIFEDPIDYTAYPYPNPMPHLPALLYVLGKELQAVGGRCEALVSADWTPATATEFLPGYVQLDVFSTLGFPDTGTLNVDGYHVPYTGRAATYFVVALTTLPPWTLLFAGSNITLAVT